MKKLRFATVAAAAMLMFLAYAPASAFHDGGVAHCDGCHIMHGQVDGDEFDGTIGTNLLRGADASSVCLECHAGSGAFRVLSDNGTNFTPGGDYFWQTIDISWVVRGNTVTRNGYENGHSIVANDFPELQAEQDLPTSPGGNFPASTLGCQSCHDPHGRSSTTASGPIQGSGSFGDEADPGFSLGYYRLLGADGYSPTNSGVTFQNDPMIAVALPNGAPNETDDHHAAYGSGSSEWCANCHEGLQVEGSNLDKHPNGNNTNLGDLATNYNLYRATGDFGGGNTVADAYLALVPFEVGTTDVTALDTESPQGPSSSANVSCLSCHRAHNSAFKYGGRWDFTEEFLVDSHPQSGDTLTRAIGGSSPQSTAYYGRDIATAFNEFQRSLCNKCHHQD